MPVVVRIRGAAAAGALMVSLFLSGCLATQQEIEDLRVDIARLQSTLAKSQTGQVESQKSLQGNQADLMSQMGTLSRNLEILSTHLEESQSRMSLLSTRLDDLDKNLSNRLDLVSEALSGAKAAVPPPPSTLFNMAYSDFTRRRYDQAIQGFQGYLEKYGDTEKAAEAQFYIGESRLAKQQWTEAQDAYDKVLVQYSTSSIVPAAYLQKGSALEKQGKTSEALAVYDAIIKKYPYRQEAGTAQSRVESLRTPPAAPPKPKSTND
ncbi:MAG: tetratricopeptide repeat protein [Elusimicrobia bacterium]|nr:tetratricopeptide repeat protein [Elusimicrobiota bacterium]